MAHCDYDIDRELRLVPELFELLTRTEYSCTIPRHTASMCATLTSVFGMFKIPRHKPAGIACARMRTLSEQRAPVDTLSIDELSIVNVCTCVVQPLRKFE
jgi:hypothetical protein